MMVFHTLSGAVYTVKDGRISREQGASPIVGGDSLACGGTVLAEPFKWIATPKLGQRAAYRLKRETVPISTSLVVRIEHPDGTVEECSEEEAKAIYYGKKEVA